MTFTSEVIMSLIGRLHPVVLHLPIGLIAGLVALEIIALGRRRPLPTEVRRLLALLLAVTAVASAVTGLLLAEQGGYAGALIERHRNLGLATAILALIAGTAALAPRSRRSRAIYGVALALATIAIVPAGHFGGEITHGVGFLTEPLRGTDRRAATRVGELREAVGPTVPDHAAAFTIIDTYCLSCHDESRPRGGLALTTIDRMLVGGDGGPAIVIGNPEASELIRRLRLDPEDDAHMPPLPRRQPSDADIETLETWIAALGAPGALDALPTTERSRPPAADTSGVPVEIDTSKPVFSDPTLDDRDQLRADIAALIEQRVHVELIDPQHGLLWIDFVAARHLSAEEIATLLKPVAQLVTDLRLAGTTVNDDAFTSIGPMPALVRLDLTATHLGAPSMALLSTARLSITPGLDTLILNRVPLDADAVQALGHLTGLRQLFVVDSELDDTQLAHLRERLPECEIITGMPPAAETLEIEPPPIEQPPDAP